MSNDDAGDSNSLRASDADRDRIADILRNAFAEGRLESGEMEERLASVWQAKTRAELDPLIEDLPEGMDMRESGNRGHVARSPYEHDPRQKSGPPLNAITVFGGSDHIMRPSQELGHTVSVFGGSDLDLRNALGPGKTVELDCYNIFGGDDVIIDDDTEVRNEMISIMGGVEIKVDSGVGENGTLVLRGLNIFGGVSVRRPKWRELRNRP